MASSVALIRAWLVVGPRSIWRAAPKITAPTLVVWGAKDRLMSVRKARAPRAPSRTPGCSSSPTSATSRRWSGPPRSPARC
ncbi:alpha/beta fold hydrolase [Actinokineospora soli]|uniref:Alpha/beta fold hydrolase n=1 Tax=Actinokineospora soli TaxID=1048753 RepID=A0ABW2TJ19_9PSEU